MIGVEEIVTALFDDMSEREGRSESVLICCRNMSRVRDNEVYWERLKLGCSGGEAGGAEQAVVCRARRGRASLVEARAGFYGVPGPLPECGR